MTELTQTSLAVLPDLETLTDGITAALHELRGASGPSWRDMLSVIKDGAILFGLVVGGILYLAASTNNNNMAELQTRLTRLETMLSLATRPRAAPGAWVPAEGVRQ